MKKLTDILECASYFDNKKSYHDECKNEWKRCRSQILKYEAALDFCVTDNVSWHALVQGNWERAIELIPQVRKEDAPLYARFEKVGVDFVRCKSLKTPLSEYTRWEIQNYFVNQDYGERIFVCNYIGVLEFVDLYANRDFMIFDGRLAAISEHNSKGELVGGWIVTKFDDLLSLMAIFTYLKSQSHCFSRSFDRVVGNAL